ncbi:hypothetical protein D5086_008829 [Populus alba]|uniref:Uncharacterized protein n=1 Tax=Populus alba TaxID=43335 RepID=A0ACC4CI98_POPAL
MSQVFGAVSLQVYITGRVYKRREVIIDIVIATMAGDFAKNCFNCLPYIILFDWLKALSRFCTCWLKVYLSPCTILGRQDFIRLVRTLSAVEKVTAGAGRGGRPSNSPAKSTREEAIFHVHGSV